MPFGDTPAFDRGIDRGVMMPVGELITSALSNKGNPTGILQDNTFRVQNAQEVRIVDNKGNVLFSGIGPDAARQAVALGQSISDEKGNKAGWTIQTGERTINTDGSVGPMRYYDVANEKVNKSVLGKIADIALPVAASFIPGVGPVLGAAIGSTASSVAQGRSLENTLLRAGLAAGGSALGGQVFGGVAPGSDAAINAVTNSAVQNAVNAGAQAGASALGSVYGSATGSLIDDIIVTALQKSAPSATGGAIGTAATSLIPSPFDGAQLSNVAPAQTQPAPVEPAPVAYTPPPEEIIATAIRQPASTAVSNIFPAVTGGISNTLLDQVINQPAQAAQPAETQQEYTPPPEEIILTAPQNILPPAFTAPEALAASAAANALNSTVAQSPDVTQGMTPEEIQDVTMKGAGGSGLLSKLTANMNLVDYLQLASLVGSAGAGLLGGGGGAGTAVPYVSPFGPGVGMGGLPAGQDRRVNPNIADYEKYGFGPEAMFFASQPGPVLAPTTPGPASAMVNPQYVPLI